MAKAIQDIIATLIVKGTLRMQVEINYRWFPSNPIAFYTNHSAKQIKSREKRILCVIQTQILGCLGAIRSTETRLGCGASIIYY